MRNLKPHMLLVLAVISFLLLSSGAGLAAQINESRGAGGYGWQQVYDVALSPQVRLTGSADRKYYDYSYKPIQLSGRLENWWAMDCGWWYVSGTPIIDTFRIITPEGNVFQTNTSLRAVNGVANVTYAWNSSFSSGRWTGQVINQTVVTQFYFYVRGKLSVADTDIYVINHTVGKLVTVNATIKDQTGKIINSTYKDNNGTSAPPRVTMYVSGSGYSYESPMTASANNWTASFTPPRHGDYYITVAATDNHTYWVDGRGRAKASMTGSFPYAFGGSVIKTGLMIFLALVWLKKSSPAGRLKGRSLKALFTLLTIAIVILG